MAEANAVVDSVSSLSSSVTEVRTARSLKPSSPLVTVTFQSGQSGLLDMNVPRAVVWAEVLHSMREANHPAYVEIDPETKYITELLQPLEVQVGEIKETASGVEVELIISHARHYLQRTRPNFRDLLNELKAAQKQGTKVLVTETLDDHQIIDVRPLEKLGAVKLK
ncbi:MAG TPA: hypothetical protein VIX89_19090 [Bryobacteraceae bacterium]